MWELHRGTGERRYPEEQRQARATLREGLMKPVCCVCHLLESKGHSSENPTRWENKATSPPLKRSISAKHTSQSAHCSCTNLTIIKRPLYI